MAHAIIRMRVNNIATGNSVRENRRMSPNSEPRTKLLLDRETLNTKIVVSLIAMAIISLLLIESHIRRIEHPSAVSEQSVSLIAASNTSLGTFFRVLECHVQDLRR